MGWLSGWSKRKAITLTGGADGSQVDFQLKLSIAYDSDMLSDFSDIRFTDADGTTLLDAWMESYTASTSATVWVETDTPENTVESDIYMYYGKSDAVSDWDGAATFIAYHGSASTDFHDANVATQPFIYEAKVRQTSDNEITLWGLGETGDLKTSTGDAISVLSDAGAGVYITSYDDGSHSYDNNTPHLTKDQWYKTKITIASTSSAVLWVEGYSPDVSITTNIPDEIMGLAMQLYDGTGGQEWSFVRKYAANPPTYEFGSEENAPTGLTILDFERAIMRGAFRGIMRGVA